MLHLSAWHKTRHQQFKDYMLLLLFHYYCQQPLAKISHGYIIRKGKDGFFGSLEINGLLNTIYAILHL